MTKVYWRPRAVSKTALMLISVLSLGGLILVEQIRVEKQREFHEEKLTAAEKTMKAFSVIREARLATGHPIDLNNDPANTGLIGLPMSAITSISGALEAKQTTLNPNFAAVLIDMLAKAGVKEGDTVAVGMSGSFPALNIAVCCALETMKAKPLIISSTAASQWGANVPELTWLDMERKLHEAGIISFRSFAATIGGHEDTGQGLSKEGHALIVEAMQRNRVPLLEKKNSFEAIVDQRMDQFNRQAEGRAIKAYLNVGGGTVSVGRSIGKKLFKPGLNLKSPIGVKKADGVMSRFSQKKVPVIHLVQVLELAVKYELTATPASLPEVGKANVFARKEYSKIACVAVLVTILGSLFAFIRSDFASRLLHKAASPKDSTTEPMV
ncbi:MAG: poly-gamma-glutamate system protein [Akkermansiaceae bacterium]|jgi:poly-gamma-glutamate system protein